MQDHHVERQVVEWQQDWQQRVRPRTTTKINNWDLRVRISIDDGRFGVIITNVQITLFNPL